LIPASAVRTRLTANPGIAMSLALDLAANVVRLTRLAEDLSSGAVECRLARVLLRLAERAGEPFPGGTLIPLRLRRGDLAAMAATTLESTSRKIAEWQRRRWIVAQPAGYLIRDIAALHALAEDR
jgi:CRP-like cAMP-binding protein